MPEIKHLEAEVGALDLCRAFYCVPLVMQPGTFNSFFFPFPSLPLPSLQLTQNSVLQVVTSWQKSNGNTCGNFCFLSF